MSLHELWDVISSGDPNQVEKIIQKAPALTFQLNNHLGFLTCLHLACIEGNSHICEILLQNGADSTVKAKVNQWTALHYSVKNGNKKCVDLLLRTSPRLIKAKNNHGQNAVFTAVQMNRPDILKALLKFKCKVNSKDHFGKSALHYAAEYGYVECVKLLVNTGAQLSQTISLEGTLLLNGNETSVNDLNKTALDLAKDQKHKSVVVFLKQHMENLGIKEHITEKKTVKNLVADDDVNNNTKL